VNTRIERQVAGIKRREFPHSLMIAGPTCSAARIEPNSGGKESVLRNPILNRQCRSVEHWSHATRDFLRTFRRRRSAFPSLAKLAMQSRPGIKDLFKNYGFWTQPSPANLRSQKLFYFRELERAMGIEPTTYSLGSCRSTTELRPRTLVILAGCPVPHPKPLTS
jgi:hypothetical protein